MVQARLHHRLGPLHKDSVSVSMCGAGQSRSQSGTVPLHNDRVDNRLVPHHRYSVPVSMYGTGETTS